MNDFSWPIWDIRTISHSLLSCWLREILVWCILKVEKLWTEFGPVWWVPSGFRREENTECSNGNLHLLASCRMLLFGAGMPWEAAFYDTPHLLDVKLAKQPLSPPFWENPLCPWQWLWTHWHNRNHLISALGNSRYVTPRTVTAGVRKMFRIASFQSPGGLACRWQWMMVHADLYAVQTLRRKCSSNGGSSQIFTNVSVAPSVGWPTPLLKTLLWRSLISHFPQEGLST